MLGVIALCVIPAFGENNTLPDADPQRQKDYILFGVYPALSPEAFVRSYRPMAEYLSARIQKNVILRSAKTYSVFLSRLEHAQYDLALAEPDHAFIAAKYSNYNMTIRMVEDLCAAIVVRSTSVYFNLEALSGMPIALPPEDSIATKMGKRFMIKTLVDNPPEFLDYKTHNAAFNALLADTAEGAVVSGLVARQGIEQGRRLRIIAKAECMPGPVLLVAKDMDPELQKALIREIMNMKNSPEGREALRTASFTEFGVANPEDYKAVRYYIQGYVPLDPDRN